jgi:hypothetical protein
MFEQANLRNPRRTGRSNNARLDSAVFGLSERRNSVRILRGANCLTRSGSGFEPATSSLGIQTFFESKSLARFCCEFLNLQPLVESAFSRLDLSNEAQMRHVLHTKILRSQALCLPPRMACSTGKRKASATTSPPGVRRAADRFSARRTAGGSRCSCSRSADRKWLLAGLRR